MSYFSSKYMQYSMQEYLAICSKSDSEQCQHFGET